MSATPPSISAILLTYDCRPFVARALESVLAQDCPPMEILVSDDASSDGTAEVIERIVGAYAGPHRVDVRRRQVNTGSKSAHLNDTVGRTTGEIVVSFDGDDIYDETRVRRLSEAFQRHAGVMAAYSGYSIIDAEGRPRGRGHVPHPPAGADPRAWFARVDAFASGSTLAVRREVFERFGPLVPDIHEDVVLPFRACLLGEVVYLDLELVQARRHWASLTSDDRRFASLEAYRHRLHEGIARARRHRDLRLADLDRALALMPERREEFEALRAVVDASLADAERTAALVSPSAPERWRAFWSVFHSGAYRDEWTQNLMLAVAPELYLRHKRRQRGIRTDEGNDGNG